VSDCYTAEVCVDSQTSEATCASFRLQIPPALNVSFSGLCRLGQVAGVVLAVASSSTTAIPDLSRRELRYQANSAMTSAAQRQIGRPISRAEALRIARRALERAERERLAIAEAEAMRGLQWEN